MTELTNGIRDLNPGEVPYASERKLRSYPISFLKDRMTRRELLKIGGLSGLSVTALWALACQPTTPAPTPTKAPVAVAPTPTRAPEAPTPTKPPVATSTPIAEKIGKHLIGKLEGAELVTDPAKFPKTLKEAPELAELVKAGKLPAVKERIGEDPLVVKPLREIGKYGGTWRHGFTGPADMWAGYRAVGHDNLLFWDYTGVKVVPNIAKGWEFSDGGRTFTLHLRRGMRWSDGQPFTADDIMFWFQDLYQYKDLVPTPTAYMSINRKPGTVEKVDAYAVRWKFADPYYLLPEILAGATSLGGHALQGLNAMGAYAPAHYLKQFHPKYVSKAELDKKVKEAKFDNWVSLFKFKNTWHLNPEMPAVTAWKTTTPANTPVWTLERNPYSIWVDSEGNQLPYIGKVVMPLGENLEIINLRAIAGEYDFQLRHLDIAKLPVFLANQAKGGYKAYLDPGDHGTDTYVLFNLDYQADPELAKWFNNRDFRRALSLAIERDQINEAFFLGLGVPRSQAPVDTNPYFPGPEYRTLWSTYEPKKANEMLDKIGLDKKDAEGYRLRTDGKGRLRLEMMTYGGQFVQFTQISEMIREHWKKVGIQADVVEVERSLGMKRIAANEQQLFVWYNGGTEYLFTNPGHLFPDEPGGWASMGIDYARWFASGGTEGKTPPPRLKELMETWLKGFGAPDEERIKLGKEVWKIALEEVWRIATVGLSPATGMRVAKVTMGNVPGRMVNSHVVRTPGIAHPETFFWKS